MGEPALYAQASWLIEMPVHFSEVAVRGANEQIKCRAPYEEHGAKVAIKSGMPKDLCEKRTFMQIHLEEKIQKNLYILQVQC